MLYAIPDTLLKVSKYNVEHGDQCYWCLTTQQYVRYNVEHGDQFYWCLMTLSTMCQV
jgi:hypothetical protein